jgi:heptosyltransferase-2
LSAVKHSKKILVVGPAWVGDMVMAQAFFKAIQEVYGDCLIDVVAPEWSGPILKRMPEIRRMICLPVAHGKLGLAIRWRLAKALRSECYDEAFVMPRSFKSALLPWFARIPKRTGHLGEMRYGVLTKRYVLAQNKARPNVCNYLQLLGLDKDILSITAHYAPKLQIDEANRQRLQQRFPAFRNKTLIAVMPGAEFGLSKQWPIESYVHLAESLQNSDVQVIVLGSSKERELGDRISASSGALNLAGETTLDDAIDVLSLCTIAVTNDSGLMHVAAAVGCKVVAIYGSTTPEYTPPLTPAARVLYLHLACSPCWERICRYGHYRCVKDISVRRVIDAVKKLS